MHKKGKGKRESSPMHQIEYNRPWRNMDKLMGYTCMDPCDGYYILYVICEYYILYILYTYIDEAQKCLYRTSDSKLRTKPQAEPCPLLLFVLVEEVGHRCQSNLKQALWLPWKCTTNFTWVQPFPLCLSISHDQATQQYLHEQFRLFSGIEILSVW